MKSKYILTLAFILSAVKVLAQYPGPFLTDDTRPDGLDWIPQPPSPLSGEFANDFYFYQWGKSQRDVIGEEALWDSSAELFEVYSESMGIELSYEKTPEIVLLAERATSDALIANKRVKNYYQRVRPFATFNEPSLKPGEDEELRTSLSYPSSHSANGWMFAFVLSTVAPERTGAIMERAREYALNRVICGHHWKSDIDAALMLSAGVFTNVVVSEDYQKQLQKAREEYQRIKMSGETSLEAPAREIRDYDEPSYRLDGTAASVNTRGIVVTNHRVVLRN